MLSVMLGKMLGRTLRRIIRQLQTIYLASAAFALSSQAHVGPRGMSTRWLSTEV